MSLLERFPSSGWSSGLERNDRPGRCCEPLFGAAGALILRAIGRVSRFGADGRSSRPCGSNNVEGRELSVQWRRWGKSLALGRRQRWFVDLGRRGRDQSQLGLDSVKKFGLLNRVDIGKWGIVERTMGVKVSGNRMVLKWKSAGKEFGTVYSVWFWILVKNDTKSENKLFNLYSDISGHFRIYQIEISVNLIQQISTLGLFWKMNDEQDQPPSLVSEI